MRGVVVSVIVERVVALHGCKCGVSKEPAAATEQPLLPAQKDD